MRKIGIDIADTIIDVWPSIMKEAEVFNKNNSNNPMIKDRHLYLPEDIYNWNEKEKEEFWKVYGSAITFNTPIKQDVVETLQYLKEIEYSIYFVTAKSNDIYKNLETKIIEMLRRYDIDYDEIYTQVSNKGTFCHEYDLDYLVDDSFDNCLKARNNGTTGILLTKSYNYDRKLLDNMYRVETFSDIKKYIKK